MHARLAIDRDVIDVAEVDPGFVEAVADRLGGQAGPMFDATKPLFLGGGNEFAIAHEAGGRVAVIGVNSEDGERDHRTTGLRDHGTTGLQDYRTTGLRDHGATGLRGYGTAGDIQKL